MKQSTVREVGDAAPSITRRRWGKGWRFYHQDGTAITEPKLKKRLKSLVIPPIWVEVQTCKCKVGHVQATGRDVKGRKQYIYHEAYEAQRQREKFDRLQQFGALLPDIRARIDQDLRQNGWPLCKQLGLIVSIVDHTGIRIGNRQYSQGNGTYGLTTLRRKHLHIEEDGVTFEFTGKSCLAGSIRINSPKQLAMIKEGTTVKWKWGDGIAKGTVVETYDEEVTKTIKGSTVTRNGKSGNKALYIEQEDGDHVLKSESEAERVDK